MAETIQKTFDTPEKGRLVIENIKGPITVRGWDRSQTEISVKPDRDGTEIEIDQHGNTVVARTTQVEVPWVIRADGHHSRMRRSLGLDYAAAGPAEHFAVFELKSPVDLNHQMRLVFDEDTTSVLWPLPDGYCRWSFQLQ